MNITKITYGQALSLGGKEYVYVELTTTVSPNELPEDIYNELKEKVTQLIYKQRRNYSPPSL